MIIPWIELIFPDYFKKDIKKEDRDGYLTIPGLLANCTIVWDSKEEDEKSKFSDIQ